MKLELSPVNLINAYAHGIFPMGDERGELIWLSPDPRAIIPLDAVRPSRSLRATIRKGVFTITVDRAFEAVMAGCADRPEGTWITPAIFDAYTTLHRQGFAHSVEAWQAGELVGGLYGVTLGGAYFGESMFRRATDASKVALIALVERMRARRFTLLDVQFMTAHLRRFGAVEIPQRAYLRRLREAIALERMFADEPAAGPLCEDQEA